MTGGIARLLRRTELWSGAGPSRLFVGLGLVGIGVHAVLPWGSQSQAYLYEGMNTFSGLVLFGGVLLRRPPRRAYWLLIAFALVLWGIGDGIFNLYDWVLHTERPYPSIADWVYLVGYAVLVLGALLLVRSRQRPRGSDVLDGAIVASGTALFLWFTAIEPVASDHTTSVLSRVVSTAYPTLDMFLLILVAQLYFSSGVRSYAFRAFTLGALVLFGIDVMYSVQSLAGTYVSGGWLDLGWLLCGVLWGSAGLHPSMRELHLYAPPPSTRLTWQRLLILAVASLVAPLLFALRGPGSADLVVIAVVSGTTTVLVFIRMAMLFREHGRAEASLREARTRAEVAATLQASNERFQAAARAMSAAIYEWRVDSDTLVWSDGLAEAFGYELSDPETTKAWWLDRVHPEDRERGAGQDAKIREHGETGYAEYRFLAADGSYRSVSDKWVSVADPGGLRRVIGGIVDISEQRDLEEQLRQAQRLEALGRLAGGVAHDFNNLLMAIGGYAELLGRRVQSDPELAEPVAQISRATDRAAALTGQMLAFSRRQVLKPQVVDVNESVTGIVSMLERLLGGNIAVELDLAPAVRRITADPTQLEQVLLNLAVNARDAMPGGGVLRLATRDTALDWKTASELELAHAGRYVELTVSDNGTGMDADTQQRIFEPFFTTKPPGEGTGLGLSTVHGIVRQSGGSILVDSVTGAGTTFRVVLPATDETAAAETRAAVAPPRERGGRVLLVEDDDLVRSVVGDMLELAGHDVTRMAGPVETELAYRHGVPFDVLVTDMIMPGLSGKELAAVLSGRNPSLKVLLISGFSEETVSPEPGQSVLGKPFDAATLAAHVDRLLRDDYTAAAV